MKTHPSIVLLAATLSTFALVASCAKPEADAPIVVASTQGQPEKPTEAPTMVRGSVSKISGSDVEVATTTGPVSVKLLQPFQVYSRVPGRLADVKDTSFVGVTSVKKADGTEEATEIHIFAPELRGMGEGSHMMTPSPNPAPSRMTNGSVSTSNSRMSNGSVQRQGASSIVVKYQGGSQTISVPPGVTVTEISPSHAKLKVGDSVVMTVQKDSSGTLSSSKAILAGK